MLRQVILDTETTGLDPKQGHRIIEIGCVEMINRRLTGNNFHYYLNPQRAVDKGAAAVHGLTNDFLQDKPLYADIHTKFFNFINGAELIIHNAPFDTGFINHEWQLNKCKQRDVKRFCTVTDTLTLARKLHPGQKNNLDALCKRYEINNFKRDLHGALLDSEILAQVYLAMTGGQDGLFDKIDAKDKNSGADKNKTATMQRSVADLVIMPASADELADHQQYLESLQKSSNEQCLWLEQEQN